MLFLWPGTSTLLRGQGTYLTDEEIIAVTSAASTGEQNFVQELVHMRLADPNQSDGGTLKHRDEVYAQAVEIVIREGRGSVSLLQRALGIGYGRAARLIDFMEQDGIVGVYAGSKSREVIMTISQWHDLQSTQSAEADAAPTPHVPTSPLISRLNSRPAPLRASSEDDEEVEDSAEWDDSNDDEDAEHEDWSDRETLADDGEEAEEDETGDDDDESESEEDEDESETEQDADPSDDDAESDQDEFKRLPLRLARPPHHRAPRPGHSACGND
jgi:S-DNA-T family DNA segregation ATPase FtsK/SpoIIIE